MASETAEATEPGATAAAASSSAACALEAAVAHALQWNMLADAVFLAERLHNEGQTARDTAAAPDLQLE